MATPIRTLIIGDRRADAQLMVRALRREGLEIEYERVSTEAAFRGQLRAAPDLILADYNVPGLSAFDALDIVHDAGLSTPFIVVSSTVSEKIANECLDRGAADILFTHELIRLGEVVRDALAAAEAAARKAQERKAQTARRKPRKARAEGGRRASGKPEAAARPDWQHGQPDELPQTYGAVDAIEEDLTDSGGEDADDPAVAVDYARLFDAAVPAMLVVDADTGEVLDANPSAGELLGCPRHALEGKRLGELVCSEDADRVEEAFRSGLEQDRFVIHDVLLQRHDGGMAVAALQAGVCEVDGGLAVTAVLFEQSEPGREAAEAVIYDHALAALDSAVVVTGSGGQPVWAAPGGESVLGYTRAELLELDSLAAALGQDTVDTALSAVPDQEVERYTTAVDAAGIERRLHVRCRPHPDGSGHMIFVCRAAEWDAGADAWMGNAFLTHAGLDEAVVAAKHTGETLFVSPNAATVLGLEADWFDAGGGLFDLLPIDALDLDALREASVRQTEWRREGPEGGEQTLEVTARRAPFDRETFIFTCRDVTARRRLETERDTALRLAALLSGAQDEAAAVCGKDGGIELIAPSFAQVLGLSQADLQQVLNAADLMSVFGVELSGPDGGAQHGVCTVEGEDGVHRRLAVSAETHDTGETVYRFRDMTEEFEERSALAARVALLEGALEAAKEGVAAVGVDRRVRYYSPAVPQLLGADHVALEDLEGLERALGTEAPAFEELERTGSLEPFEAIIEQPGQTARYLEVSAARSDAGTPVYYYRFSDVTAAEERIQALAARAALLEYALSGAGELVVICNDYGSIELISPNSQQVLGWTPEELGELPAFRETVHELAAALADGAARDCVIAHADGAALPFEVRRDALSDWPGAFRYVFRDVRQEKALELDIARRDRILEAVSGAAAAAALLTTPDGGIVYASANCEPVIGYTAQEVEGLGRIGALLTDPFYDAEELERAGSLNGLACSVIDIAGHQRALTADVRRLPPDPAFDDGLVLYRFHSETKTDRLESELEYWEALVEAITSVAHEAVLISRPRGGFAYVSPSAPEVFGASEQQIYAMAGIADLLGEDALVLDGTVDDGAVPGQQRCAVTERGGSVRHFDVTVRRTPSGEGSLVYGCRDVTAEVEAMAARDAMAKLHERTLSAVSEGVIVAEKYGAIAAASDAAARLIGQPAGALAAGDRMSAVFPGMRTALGRDGEAEAAGEDGAASIPQLVWEGGRPGDGGPRAHLQLWQHGTEDGLTLYTLRDVSEAVRGRQSLDDAERLLESVFSAVPDPLFVLDETGRVRMASNSAERLFGEEHTYGNSIPEMFGLPLDTLTSVAESEHVWHAPGGGSHVFRLRALASPGGAFTVLACEVLTEVRRLETAVEYAQAIRDALAAAWDGAAFITDAEGVIAEVLPQTGGALFEAHAESLMRGGSVHECLAPPPPEFEQIEAAGPRGASLRWLSVPGADSVPVWMSRTPVVGQGDAGGATLELVVCRDAAHDIEAALEFRRLKDIVAHALQTMHAAAFVTDARGQVLGMAPGSEAMLCAQRMDRAADALAGLLGGPLPDIHADGTAHTEVRLVERPGGGRLPLRISTSAAPGEPGLRYFAVQQMPELLEIERERARVERALNVLRLCAEAESPGMPLEAYCERLCRELHDAGCACALVALPPADAGDSLALTARAGGDETCFDARALPLAELERRGTPAAAALAEGAPVHVDSIADEAGDAEWMEDALARGWRSCLALPLAVGGKPAGVMTLYAFEQGHFDAFERAMLDLVAQRAAGVLRSLEAETASAAEIDSLATSLHFRDWLLDHVAAPVAVLDPAGQRIYYNAACDECTRPAAVSGEVAAPWDTLRDAAARAGTERGAGPVHAEWRYTRQDDAECRVLWTVATFKGPHGAAEYAVCSGSVIEDAALPETGPGALEPGEAVSVPLEEAPVPEPGAPEFVPEPGEQGASEPAAGSVTPREALLSAALQACPAGVIVIALDERHEPAEVLAMSEAARQLLGMSAADEPHPVRMAPYGMRDAWEAALREWACGGTRSVALELEEDAKAPRHIEADARLFSGAAGRALAVALHDAGPAREVKTALRRAADGNALMARLAVRLIAPLAKELDAAIDEALASFIQFHEADRAVLCLFLDDGAYFGAEYEAAGPGLASILDELREVPAEKAPWMVEQLRRAEPVHAPSLEALPADASADRGYWRSLGAESIAAVPMVYGKTVVGFVCLVHERGRRTWDGAAVEQVDLLGRAVVQALVRKKAEAALRNQHRRLEAALRCAPAGIMVCTEGGEVVEANTALGALAGQPASETAGMTVGELLRGEPSMDWQRHTRDAEALGRVEVELSLTPANQRNKEERVAVDAATAPMQVSGARLFVTVLRDITPRRQTERALLEFGTRQMWRVGHRLHDGLAKSLAEAGGRADRLSSRLRGSMGEGASEAETMSRMMRDALNEARDLVRVLAPVPAHKDGLMLALQDLAQAVTQSHGAACNVNAEGPIQLDDPFVATQLFYIVREGAANAVKHAQARRIGITLKQSGERLSVYVQDDGIGIPDDWRSRGGWGIRLMEYRARLIDGMLSIQGRGDGGTAVRCTVRLHSA